MFEILGPPAELDPPTAVLPDVPVASAIRPIATLLEHPIVAPYPIATESTFKVPQVALVPIDTQPVAPETALVPTVVLLAKSAVAE